MKQVLIRTIVRSAAVLAGILLVSSALQFMIWARGPESVEVMMKNMSFTDERGREQTKDYLYRELGLDHPFIPDLWPFDNESLWHKTKPSD
jgi:hypothetical protein